MFASFARSWRYTRMSYGILWNHKHLMLFPMISTIAAIVVTASFILPLWGTGTLENWITYMDADSASLSAGQQAMMYITAFVIYYINYFVIVFFNTGLIACALRILNGGEAGVGFGISFAMKRLPEIMGWAFLSAVVGVILKMIENVHERAGDIIALLIGSAWTALSFFVVPVIVVEGAGPFKAFKRSLETLRSNWGTALTGNFSLGLITILLMAPVILLLGVMIVLALETQSMAVLIGTVMVGLIVLMALAAATSAADAIFKAVLFRYATGRKITADVDTSEFAEAFKSRKKK